MVKIKKLVLNIALIVIAIFILFNTNSVFAEKTKNDLNFNLIGIGKMAIDGIDYSDAIIFAAENGLLGEDFDATCDSSYNLNGGMRYETYFELGSTGDFARNILMGKLNVQSRGGKGAEVAKIYEMVFEKMRNDPNFKDIFAKLAITKTGTQDYKALQDFIMVCASEIIIQLTEEIAAVAKKGCNDYKDKETGKWIRPKTFKYKGATLSCDMVSDCYVAGAQRILWL